MVGANDRPEQENNAWENCGPRKAPNLNLKTVFLPRSLLSHLKLTSDTVTVTLPQRPAGGP